MAQATTSIAPNLKQRQERAVVDFLEQHGYDGVQNVVFVPDETEPLGGRAVHVQMQKLRFTYKGEMGIGRRYGEISAIGLEIPSR